MKSWSSGYVADVGYTFGYYGEMNPLRSQFVMLYKGIVFPEYGTACELGYGQGFSANIHAAASDTLWLGTDFNPAQASFAQELAKAAASNARLYDDSFLDFCNRSDLPDFDYICLHGVWSWISEENRQILIDFFRRKLKVGGLLNISYNTLPGWAPYAPMRHLMAKYTESMTAQGTGTVARVDSALEFVDKLVEVNPLYAIAYPGIQGKQKDLHKLNRNYLAHEYFNRDWMPMYFSEVAEQLSSAKLEFACSVNYLDQIDSIHMTQEQAELLSAISDVTLQQTVRDFIVNCQFRRDYWVKGKRTWPMYSVEQRLQNFRVILCCDRSTVTVKAEGALGQAKINDSIYGPILDTLAGNKILTIGQISEQLADNTNISSGQLIEAMLVLINGGYVAPVQPESTVEKAKRKTDALNKYLVHRIKGDNSLEYLASPVIGGGISVNQFQQHFIRSILEGEKMPEKWAEATWEHLSSRGHKMVVEGKELQTAEENLAELNNKAQVFAKSQLPVLKALKII